MACQPAVQPIVPFSTTLTRTLHDCPCPGTPLGLNFENRTLGTKITTPAASGTIELDWTNAVSECASAHLRINTTGCFCINEINIELCLPEPTIGTPDSPYTDLGEFLVNAFNQHWGVSGFMHFQAVGSATAKKAKVMWQSTTEGLYPHVEFDVAGYMDHADNGVTGTITETDVQKVKCEKFHCGEPVGLLDCDTNAQNYTDTNKDTLRFAGITQEAICGTACDCDCAPTCKCPPVRALTDGMTPLKFDRDVAISPGAHILIWDTAKRVYGLLTDAEVAAMPATSVVLTRNASLHHCCKSRPDLKAIRFTA